MNRLAFPIFQNGGNEQVRLLVLETLKSYFERDGDDLYRTRGSFSVPLVFETSSFKRISSSLVRETS